jgi:uncharacterized protein (DUF736 family)
MVAARQQTETTMATIGTFTASDNGYTGSVKTLTLNVKAKFVATEKDNDKAPDYRIFAGATEFGAAWKKTARETEREYLSVKLDDPSFPAPIYGADRMGARTFGLLVRAEIAKGSALARARVKHRPGAGRSGLPGLPRRRRICTATLAPGACRRARAARPFGRVIPLRSGRPCSCYPGLADGQGCSAALRFNLSLKEKRS